MPKDRNFANSSELREIASLAELLEAANFNDISLGYVPIMDSNGDQLGVLVYIGGEYVFQSKEL